MKKHYLIALLFLFYVGDAAALPDCPSSGYFDNCYGSYEWDDGDKYVGEFKDNKMHGQGTYTFPDGDKYVGEFIDDKGYGQGTYTYANGAKYVGEIKDGKKHGQGTYTYSDGTADRGFFSNDEFVPDICEDMGLKKGSAEFGNCVLKLMDD